jgi:cytochrome c-type biogenesis protein CcmF
MGRYMVTYEKDTVNPLDRKRYFEIDFKSKQGNDNFKLYPDVIKNNKGMEGFAANPASKHYWYKDIFVYITSFQENKEADTTQFQNRTLKVKDTLFYSNGMIVLNSVNINPVEQKNRYAPDEMALFLDMTVISKEGKLYRANPGIAIKGQSELRQLADTVMSQSLILVFNKVIDQKTGKLEIGLKETGNITDLLTLKVYEFPMINLLWLGVVITVLGFIMSIIQRVKVSGEKLTKTV